MIRSFPFFEHRTMAEVMEVDDCAAIEIILLPSVYAELLVRLERFVDRQDNQADRSWISQFVKDLRMREMEGLH